MGQQVQYQSKTDLAAAALRRMIESGELPPGTFLRQRDVAEMLGVSATPVREAFRRLEGEGFIIIEPHRASVVVRSEDSRLLENAQIRAALEGLGSAMAASRITETEIEELEALNRRIAGGTDAEAVRDANRQFHFRVYEITGSPVLLAQINLLWRMIGNGPHVQRSPQTSAQQHEAIIEALRSHDPEKAEAETRRHILEAHGDPNEA